MSEFLARWHAEIGAEGYAMIGCALTFWLGCELVWWGQRQQERGK